MHFLGLSMSKWLHNHSQNSFAEQCKYKIIYLSVAPHKYVPLVDYVSSSRINWVKRRNTGFTEADIKDKRIPQSFLEFPIIDTSDIKNERADPEMLRP